MVDVTSCDDIVSTYVENQQGEELGIIEALMLDENTGKIAYIILSLNLLDSENKLCAIPWHIFTYNIKRGKYILAINKARLKTLPSFDKKHWPDMNSPAWVESMRHHFENIPTILH